MKIGGTGDVSGPRRIYPQGGKSNTGSSAPQAAPGDRVEISGTARLIESLSRVPEVRQDKVAAARQLIAAGQMDTPERWNVAVDRLVDDMLGG